MTQEDRRKGWAIRLQPPEDVEGKPLWICKLGGNGAGWTLSPDPRGRIVCARKGDAELQLNRLPVVAEMRIEQGWQPELFKVRPKKEKKKRSKSAKEKAKELFDVKVEILPNVECATAQDLFLSAEQLFKQAERLVCELDLDDSVEGYFAGMLHSSLAAAISQGRQLFHESSVSA